ISLIGAIAQRLVGVPKPVENSLLYLVIVTMSLQGSMVLAPALFLWARRLKWRDAFGFSKSGLVVAILFGLSAALIFYPVANVLQAVSMEVISRFHIKTPPQEAVVTLQDATAMASR